MWGFPKIGVPFWGVPLKGLCTIVGVCKGYPYFSEIPMFQVTPTLKPEHLANRCRGGRNNNVSKAPGSRLIRV